ncbi:unnamed protein product [Amoebophrya sp. A120]|nr:unnamed protein product [Amoebophrya sp. A120]|eukprot:GSA120T00020431001.1
MSGPDEVDFEVLNDDIELLLQTLQEELKAKQETDDFHPDFGDLLGAWGMSKHGDPNSVSILYNCLEFAICGTEVENFELYETCFAALTKISMFLGQERVLEHLVALLMNINEIYDVLLNCVETYEWVQPGVTGLLRMYMLQTLFSVVGYETVTGKHLMELTNNDIAGAVSLVCFVIRCGECTFQLQEAAARCLVDLTTADAVFFRDEKMDEDYNNQDIAKLTALLNKHVNGLIMSIIEFELVDAFGRCICQHQQSHLRTDIIIRFFLTALHNCLLYCSENQKKLRMHLATQSTIIQDIMFPYVDNILPALYENTKFTLDGIEYQNLKATLQTFVVITFNINVFRAHFQDTDFLLRILEAPLVPSSLTHMELIFKILVNADISKARFKDEILQVVEQAYAQLPPERQQRLQRRVVESSGHSLPLSRANVKAMQMMPFLFGEISDDVGANGMGVTGDDEEGRGRSKWRRKKNRTRKRNGKYGLQWVRKKEKDSMFDSEEESDTEEMEDGSGQGQNPEDQQYQQEPGTELQQNADNDALCQLSGAFMTDPVKTPYGHVFDRQALADWLQFSATDPICGQPLIMDDCVPYTELQAKIFEEQLASLSGQVLNTQYDPAAVAQERENLDLMEQQQAAEQAAQLQLAEQQAQQQAVPATSQYDQTNLGDLPALDTNQENKKEKKEKGKIKIASRSLIDAPPEFRCEIDGKVMTNPIRSPYGNYFEKKTLEKWIESCGSVCPLTQKPLRLEDCVSDKEMKHKVVAWLKENMAM